MTATWYAGVGPAGDHRGTWPMVDGNNYGGDVVFGVDSVAYLGNGGQTKGIPAAADHGGSYSDGVSAGVFFLDLNTGASSPRGLDGGFRCAIR